MNRIQTIPRFGIPYTLEDFSAGLAAVFDRRLPDPAGFGDVLAPGEKFWTGSGRQALALILRALGLKTGAGVAIPLYADLAVSSAVHGAGYVPVFVDVDPRTLTMDPRSLIRARGRVSAIVAVHLFGHMAPMDEILAIAGELPVVEDTVHSPLSFLNGRQAGSFGVACFYSFGSTKCLAAGGGGLAVTGNPDLALNLATVVWKLVPQGWLDRFRNCLGQATKAFVFRRPCYGLIGRPLRPFAERHGLLEPDLDRRLIQPGQAAIGLRQAKTYRERVERQRHNGKRLRALLSDLDGIVLPHESPRARHNFHFFPVLLHDAEERAAVAAGMLQRHVDTSRIYYNVAEHARRLGYENDCPSSESVARRILTLPNYAELAAHDIDYIAQAFREAVDAHRSRRRSRQRVAIRFPEGRKPLAQTLPHYSPAPLHRMEGWGQPGIGGPPCG